VPEHVNALFTNLYQLVKKGIKEAIDNGFVDCFLVEIVAIFRFGSSDGKFTMG
jgi:hypothetical protein